MPTKICDWNELPNWIQKSLIRWVNSEQRHLRTPLSGAFVSASPGDENGEWYVEYRADNGAIRELCVSPGNILVPS